MKKNFGLWAYHHPTLKKLIMELKIALFIIFATVSNVFATLSYSQIAKVSLNMKNKSLEQVMDVIEKQSEFYFIFNQKQIDVTREVDIKAENKLITDVLPELFAGTNVHYTVFDRKILLTNDSKDISLPANLLEAQQQQQTITGTISDENKSPMPGVNIVIEGTSIGTISDINGKYTLGISNPNAALVFSFIGYDQKKIAVAGKNVINVSMTPVVSSLDEVVVIGYGTVKKSDLTGSVSAVSQDTYKDQPVSRVDDILQGRSAGVNVTSVSGAPGGTTSIRIRGSNSITGSNEPLYVIDGFVGGNMSNINPTDIESIQILKDASSTAIYGSRGSNGVVLITTKKGSAGKQKITVTSRYTTSQVLKKWDLLNAGEFATVVNQRADALGYSHRFTDQEVANYIANGGTDWQNLLYRTGDGQEVQLDYSGGNETTTYFVSGNFNKQNGIVINSDYKRYSLRTNIDTKITSKLKAALKMNYSRRETNNTGGALTTNSAIAGATAWAPTTPAYTSAGTLTINDPISSIKSNPIELATNDAITESNSIQTVGNFVYKIMDGLSLDLGFGMDYTNSQGKNFTQNLQTNAPSASRSSRSTVFLQNTNMLTYSKIFNKIHNLVLTAVAEYQYQKNESFTASATSLMFPQLKYNNLNLASTYTLANTYTKSTIGSYIGRVNYTLMDKYLLTASVRSDRSSKFRGSNQTSIFPSVGLGWRISQENFLKGIPTISNLKLRGSWGKTGSQAIDVYGTVTSYNTTATAGAAFTEGVVTSGINIGDPGNSKLKWETTAQTNVGFDLGLLKDRFTLEADYFYKKTTDLLLNEPLPGYVGGGNIFRNVGEVENKGFEFNANARLIHKKDFSWNLNVNYSMLENKVLSLGSREYILQTGGAGAGQLTASEMILKPGYSLSSYYGYKSLGIWQTADAAEAAKFNNKPGDYRYEDLNGDHAITAADFQIIGSGMPKKVLGVNNTFTYKNFTLNAFFQGMFDYDKWNFAYAQIMIAAADAREFTHRDILNRWSPENPTSRVAAFSKTNVPQIQSSEYIESGNYIRLKNISLQYTLPKNAIKWGTLSAQVSAQNLLTITNYKGIDPETYSNMGSGDARGGDGGAYPNSKQWTIGLTLSF
jgi:TonB-linked SusC/RagA family outer membrane protein